MTNSNSQTLYDKLWSIHEVLTRDDGSSLIYIDRHILHEVTSAQAFEGLRLAKRKPWRINANIATADHNIPTTRTERLGGINAISDDISKIQVQTLTDNCTDFGITEFAMNDIRQGIVHVIGPEQGATLPGMTIVCGDSHTSTHGAFGALAHGIGTSEVEHVLATQCLITQKMRNMQIKVDGVLAHGVSAKDLALYIIGKIGTAGGTGFAVEFTGNVITNMTMEGRMTLCNMAIEAGARVGLIAVDATTIEYVKNRPLSPKGKQLEQAISFWQTLVSDADASFDKAITIDAGQIKPCVTWGTSPEMVAAVTDCTPNPADESDPVKRNSIKRALDYMGLQPQQKITDIKLDKIFIGSCTNSRIEDLRIAANIIKGQKIASNIKLALVVPGSGLVKKQAEQEGLDQIFINAGFEWRQPGCSMCLAMNADKLETGERCASTSNRNFEGRQGAGSRTHLVSPAMAAAAAIAGHFVNVQDLS